MMEWYAIKNTEVLDTPALVIYPDRVQNNIAILKGFVGDVRQLRPHIKTSKSPEVVRIMLEAGITKFKCATIAEAEMLALQDAKNVLLAYQPVGPNARRYCELQKKFAETSFSCLIDNAESLRELSVLAGEYGEPVQVLIDLNVGMNRTGITPGKDALRLYREATRSAGISFLGLHAYDGHLRDVDFAVRTQKCDAAFHDVQSLMQEISEDMGKDPVVVAGGTPTFPIHAKRPGVETSPGTFIFWDKGYQQILPEQPFEFAALVVTRIICKPNAESICIVLGHKSIAAENPITQRVYFLNAPDLTPTGHSEEHMVFRTKENATFRVGDVLYGVPYHICPTVALYEDARICRENTITDTWPILARKRKITI